MTGRNATPDERCACGRPVTDTGACSLCEYVPERCNCVSAGREASPERDEHDRCTGCLYSAGHALDCPLYPQPEPGRDATPDDGFDFIPDVTGEPYDSMRAEASGWKAMCEMAHPPEWAEPPEHLLRCDGENPQRCPACHAASGCTRTPGAGRKATCDGCGVRLVWRKTEVGWEWLHDGPARCSNFDQAGREAAAKCPSCGAPPGFACRYLDRKRPLWRGREKATPHPARVSPPARTAT